MSIVSLSQLNSITAVGRSDLLEISVKDEDGVLYKSRKITFDDLEKSLSLYGTVGANSAAWNNAAGGANGLAPKRRSVIDVTSQAETLTYSYLSNDTNNAVYLVKYQDNNFDCEITLPTGPTAVGFTATFAKNLGSQAASSIRLKTQNGGLIGSTTIIRSTDKTEYFTNLTVQCIDGTNYVILGGHGSWSNV